MANRRMFSKEIVHTDSFLDMGGEAQSLYFHLGLMADDDGFIHPKKIMRMVNASDDSIKLLKTKGFVIPFESGIIVIRHWRENNYIQSDRYKKSLHSYERSKLLIDNNGYYQHEDEHDTKNPDGITLKRLDTKCIQSVSTLDTQVRLGKVRNIPLSAESVSSQKPKRNQIAFKLRDEFGDMFEKRFKRKPIADMKGYYACLRAEKVLGEANVRRLFKDWIYGDEPEENVISLTRCLSNVNIDRWRVAKNIK